jgi:uncharacterized protein (DUF2235 family)
MQPHDCSEQTKHGKNIIVLCDGTGNQFIADPQAKGSNSNVVKLYTALKVHNPQVAYYHPGVGTAGDPSAKSWIAKKWSVLKGLAFAYGFKDNVLDAYRYLMETYDDGDRVFMFGFSRGSYTVRALAGLLDGYGLLCRGNEGHLPYAWNAYVQQHDDRKRHHIVPNQRFKETFSRLGFRIHFMGIWDTVSSVGWITTPLRLFSVSQNPLILTGRHAISIDERRCFYRDNLWAHADNATMTKSKATQAKIPNQDLLQLWFAGVHSDTGGSYPQMESGLSNIPLEWLLREAGLACAEIQQPLARLILGVDARPTGDEHLDRKIDELLELYPKPTASIVHKSLKGAWWLLELLPHRYYDKDDGAENWRTPLGMRRRIPRGAFIHKSVVARLESESEHYNPKNLKGGIDALQPVNVSGQEENTVYEYGPANDPQPLLNRFPVRITVMTLVSAADVVALLMGPALLWLLWHRRYR